MCPRCGPRNQNVAKPALPLPQLVETVSTYYMTVSFTKLACSVLSWFAERLHVVVLNWICSCSALQVIPALRLNIKVRVWPKEDSFRFGCLFCRSIFRVMNRPPPWCSPGSSVAGTNTNGSILAFEPKVNRFRAVPNHTLWTSRERVLWYETRIA